MFVATATTVTQNIGPLSHIVAQFTSEIESRAEARGCTAADWAPLSQLVAVNEFERVGAYQEVMTWNEYVKFLTQWAGATRFETTVRRITEVGRVVFHEIEERHFKDKEFIKKNVIAIYEFDDRNKIRHLDIYEQAQDTGRWIVEAAQASLDLPSAS
jgi:limonene-1,2-epoxide hydrolase